MAVFKGGRGMFRFKLTAVGCYWGDVYDAVAVECPAANSNTITGSLLLYGKRVT